MRKSKLLNSISCNFRSYKISYTMFAWGLSGVLSILGNIFGTLYLVLSFLPVFVWGVLMTNDRKNTDL